MLQYHKDLQHILDNGHVRPDRTGTGTLGVFGLQTRYDLRKYFPAVTTKKLAWKGVVSELLWFLEGSTDERRLAEILHQAHRQELADKRTIWTANADAQGVALGYRNDSLVKELGPVYGSQWRNFGGVDQVQQLIHNLKTDPYSRRHILNAWNAGEIDQMALPPCHVMSQFYVRDVGVRQELSCQMYQRSADFGLGVPFNIASYALLTHMLAQICGFTVGDFVHTVGDAHIYTDHIGAIKQQLQREPLPAPRLIMPKFESLEELLQTKTSDYVLDGYQHHPPISMNMAV